jgi:hypothetical protein
LKKEGGARKEGGSRERKERKLKSLERKRRSNEAKAEIPKKKKSTYVAGVFRKFR